MTVYPHDGGTVYPHDGETVYALDGVTVYALDGVTGYSDSRSIYRIQDIIDWTRLCDVTRQRTVA